MDDTIALCLSSTIYAVLGPPDSSSSLPCPSFFSFSFSSLHTAFERFSHIVRQGVSHSVDCCGSKGHSGEQVIRRDEAGVVILTVAVIVLGGLLSLYSSRCCGLNEGMNMDIYFTTVHGRTIQ